MRKAFAGDGAEVVGRLGQFDLIFADAPGGKIFKLRRTVAALREGGVIVVDDMDLALALLADRIADRAAQNAAAAKKLAGAGLSDLHELARRAEAASAGWRLLVTEFRVYAARDPELSRRYAAVHAATVDGLASAVASAAERNGRALAVPARQLAELLLGIETGLALEQLADPGAVGLGQLPPVLGELAALLAGSPASSEIEELRQP